jgi:hypothetical protein
LRTIILAATALVLAGCGFYHWHKDGADSAAFDRDSTACQQQSPGAPAQQQSGSAQQKPTQSPWEACMTGRGWVYSSGW